MKRRVGLSILLAILLLSVFIVIISEAGEPPREPILRIETGMHTATIWRIGIDAANKYLVTASDDKTVRLWELATGRLLKIYRPPIGGGNEGRIYSVAISPDGKTVACGGWIGYEWEKSYSIYLFDRESGRVFKRIRELPNRIVHLAYSKDGRFLAATLRGSNGLTVYRTTDYALAAEDRDYSDGSSGADFAADGRLVTASSDGFLRLYDAAFKLIAKKKAPGGNRPFSVSFSPDGVRIGVGFSDSTKVDILSGRDLSYLYSPDAGEIDNGNLMSVTWSSDGRFLYAGGRYGARGLHPILRWSDAGQGEFRKTLCGKQCHHAYPSP